MKFLIEGTRSDCVKHEIHGVANVKEAVDIFKEIFPGQQIVSINGVEVHGFCEGCSLPIYDGDDTVSDPDGVTLHRQCVPDEMLEGGE